MTHTSDLRVHFGTWQLSAFTWLCTLSNLDLQLLRINQVIAGDAKTPRSDLFDSAVAGVAGLIWKIARGILSTCYAAPTDPTLPRAAYLDALRASYGREAFVHVVDRPPDTAHVRGSNRVHVGAWLDERAGRVVAMGAIDNLVKGAAGQAVQALNAVMGWPEELGLQAAALFP